MIREVLTDEKGSLSAARTFLLGSLVFTGALIVLDSTVWEVPGTAYTLLGSLVSTADWGRGFWYSEVYQGTCTPEPFR